MWLFDKLLQQPCLLCLYRYSDLYGIRPFLQRLAEILAQILEINTSCMQELLFRQTSPLLI